MEIKLIIEIIFLTVAIWIVYKGIRILNQGERKIEQIITNFSRSSYGE
ncbi:hypothetical protein HY792_04445 [Candidatus Desantisbacteria bacterium]|nr:hypothetical protein [Candidatus Desantisbacteria bacterium]